MSEGRRLYRWPAADRLAHWLHFIGFTTCLITGLPLFDGRLFGFITYLVGGPAAREFLHHWFGPALMALGILILARRLPSIRRSEIWLTREDIDALTTMALRKFGLTDKPVPEIGFHHPGEKVVFLVVLITLPLLGFTGFSIIFKLFPKSVLLWLRWLHSLAFMLVGVIIAGHFTMGISPSEWPVLKAMFLRGWVEEKWARWHSPGWAKKVLGEK